MERIKYLYSMYKNYAILTIGIILVLLLGCGAFFVIHSKYSTVKKSQGVDIIAKVEEKQANLEGLEETNPTTIKVDIKGLVASPGVYELEEGSRVVDAINKAGGLLENAYTRYINLSKVLKDESILIVNSKGEIDELKKGDDSNAKTVCENINTYCLHTNEIITNNYEDKNTDNVSSSSKEETNSSLNISVNINKASKEELMTLSGIGESKALKIIEYRITNGEFKTIEDIMNVNGIGQAMYEKIKDYITVG